MTKTAAKGRFARGRGPGESAGLDIRQIVEAAKSLGAPAPTMQAVADTLQVDRKALNHHVKDRQTLLELIALDAFGGGFSSVDVSGADTWEEACRAYALSFTDGLLAAGGLVEHLWFGDSLMAWFLEPTESLFQHFTKAGFDDESAVRLVTMLSTLCLGHARDVVHASKRAERPRPGALRSVLGAVDRTGFENLERISALGVDTYGRRQLDYAIDVFLDGAAAALERAGGEASAR